MDPVILAIFVAGVVVTILLPTFLMKNVSGRMHFEQMDGPKLIQTNVRAGMTKGRLRLAAYLIPLPVIILTRYFAGHEYQRVIIGVAFIVVFACLAGAQFFGVIDKLTTAEIDSRKDEEPDSGGSADSKNDPPVMPGR